MFNLSKRTEYGLMALIHLSGLDDGDLAKVSQIAHSTAIPKELLAKILSELVRANLAVSCSGPTGGFKLARPATTVSLAEILNALEKKYGLTECMSDDNKCRKAGNCAIAMPLAGINQKFRRILEQTMLIDFISHNNGHGPLFQLESALSGEEN